MPWGGFPGIGERAATISATGMKDSATIVAAGMNDMAKIAAAGMKDAAKITAAGMNDTAMFSEGAAKTAIWGAIVCAAVTVYAVVSLHGGATDYEMIHGTH